MSSWLRSQDSMVLGAGLCCWPTAPRLLGRRAARSLAPASLGWQGAPRRSLADIATPNPRVFLDVAIGSGEPQRITFEVRQPGAAHCH